MSVVAINDTFTDANGTLLETHVPASGSWIKASGTSLTIQTNQLSVPVNVAATYQVSGGSVSDSNLQFAFISGIYGAGFYDFGILLRATSFSPISGYALMFDFHSGYQFQKIVGGVSTILFDGSRTITFAANDILQFDVKGTTLSFNKNSVLVHSLTDTTYASGNMGFFCMNAGVGSNISLDNAVGNVSSGQGVIGQSVNSATFLQGTFSGLAGMGPGSGQSLLGMLSILEYGGIVK